MFHGVGMDGQGGVRLEEKNLRELLDGVLSSQTRIAGIIEERTGLSAEEVAPLFREAQTKDATYAVGTGIVHEIKDVAIPPGGPFISLVFQR